jgi:hypothetical protein
MTAEMARAFGQRPSSLLDLDADPLLAYAIDESLFVRLRVEDAERVSGERRSRDPRGAEPPSPDDLIGVPVIGADGVSRYLEARQN